MYRMPLIFVHQFLMEIPVFTLSVDMRAIGNDLYNYTVQRGK